MEGYLRHLSYFGVFLNFLLLLGVIRGHISLRMGFREVALNFKNLNFLPQEVWWFSKRLEVSLLFFGGFHSTASQGLLKFFNKDGC